MFSKPTFGQATAPQFGGFNSPGQAAQPGTSSPFGQNAFSKPATATPGFPAPGFGTGSTMFGGGATASSPGLFGNTAAPAFGQQPQQTAAGFSGFNAGTSAALFGGNTGVSSFAQPKPAFGGFGAATSTSSGLFGAQPTISGTSAGQPGSSMFNQGMNLFSSGFGGSGAAGGAATSGTPIKFNAPTGTDSMAKNGLTQTINTRHQCITCMKEYENKSLEELRLEDLQAGRKGPTGGDGLFGAVGAAQTQQSSLFGASGLAQPGASGTGFGDNKTLFGSTAPTSTGLGGFGTAAAGFGAPNQVTGGGLFGKPTGFGTTTTTSASGFSFNNNNPTTANPFGAANQNKPFGAAAPGSMFGGQQNPGNVFGAQNTTGFGAAGFGAQQQQQQGIGLFGQNKAATPFGMTPQQPATSTAFNFGQNTAINTQGGGLFGAKPQLGTTMGTSFGAGSLFGAKPAGAAAAPNFGSTFGAPTNTGLAGANNTLFGQSTFGKPGAPNQGFGFGQTQPGVAAPNQGLGAGGVFGSTLGKPAAAGGMFGGSGGGLFGAPTGGAPAGFGLGTGNPFGNTGLSSGGLNLGQTPNLGFNTNKPPMFSTGFGNTFGGQQNTMSSQDAHQRITALVANPFDRAIFNGLPTDKLEKMMAPTNPAVLKTLLNQSPSYSISSTTSKPRLLVSPKTLTPSKKSLFDGLETTPSTPKLLLGNSVYNTPSFDHKRLNLRPNRVDTSSTRESPEPLDRNASGSPAATVPSPSTPILTLKETPTTPAASTSQEKITETPCSSASEKNRNQDFNTPVGDLQRARRLALDELQSPLNDSNASASSFDLTVQEDNEDVPPHPAGIKLKRPGYFTIPTLVELAEVTDNNGQCVVDSFTIGRENYGNIYFDGPIDVSGLDLDDLVHIRHREVMVYPNDDKKHPEGQGLNRKAIVTLDNIYPMDKTTREPITSAEALKEIDYETFLRRKCSKMDSHFLEYRPETGSFVFKVSHFSKYEVSEESEAEELQAQAGAKKARSDLKQVVAGVPLQQQTALASQQTTSSQMAPQQQLLASHSQFLASPVASSHVHHTLQGPVDDFESMDEGVPEAQSPTDQLSRHAGTDTCKMRLMKASLFTTDEPEPDLHISMHLDFPHGSIVAMLDTPPPSVGHPGQFDTEMYMEEEEKQETRPRRGKQHPALVTPSHHMMPARVTLKHTCCYADAALYFSRCFKSSWGPNTTLLMSEDLSIHQTAPYQQSDNFVNWVQRHLTVQLRHSGVINEGSVVPRRCIQPGLAPLEEHCQVVSQVQEQDSRERLIKQVLQLCLALWGPLVTVPDDAQPPLVAHRRKEALGDWLQSVIEDQEQEDNEDLTKLSKLQNVLQHLHKGRLLDSVFESQKQGEHYSALVMATAGSSTSTRQLMQRQLQEWVSDGVSSLINPTRLKIWLMSGAGLPLLTLEDGDTLNALEGLDWITCLAVHYWYLCSPGASIPDVLIRYEQAFTGENCFAAAPVPSGGTEENLDIRFHLLKLFSQRTYSLEKLLRVETHFPETPLDTSLSWLVLVLLDSLRYTHVEGYCSQSVHLAFSEQLEAAGLWHLAIFVLQHISDPNMRDSAVEQMVGRHVTIESSDCSAPNELSPREDYVVNQLDIPSTMIFRAKSYLAACRQMHEQTACYQLLAGEWAACHRTLVDHLAADAVINDKYDQVLRLLKSLRHHCEVIDGWEEQGQVFFSYLSLLEEVRSWKLAGEERGFGMSSPCNMEALHQRVYSLINQAAKLPVKIPRDRLCQCEIARRSVTVARLMICGSSSKFSGMVDTLPLPDDYRLQELQQAAKQITEEFK